MRNYQQYALNGMSKFDIFIWIFLPFKPNCLHCKKKCVNYEHLNSSSNLRTRLFKVRKIINIYVELIAVFRVRIRKLYSE